MFLVLFVESDVFDLTLKLTFYPEDDLKKLK